MNFKFLKFNKKASGKKIGIIGDTKNKNFSKPFKVALLILIPLLIITAVYFALDRAGYIKAFQLGLEVQQQQQQADQNKVVLDSLKKILLLPDDEVVPTMAIISDIEALKTEQPGFFGNAKNGDRIIIYPTLAVIYDYEANKIMHIGPVTVQPELTTESTSEEEMSSADTGEISTEIPAETETETPSEQ